MSLKINTGLEPTWFTLKGQEDDPAPARFKVKPLNQIDYLAVCQETQQTESGGIMPSASAYALTLAKGLVDWENIEDENGKPLKFSKSNFGLIPAQFMFKVFEEIFIVSSIDEEDEKN